MVKSVNHLQKRNKPDGFLRELSSLGATQAMQSVFYLKTASRYLLPEGISPQDNSSPGRSSRCTDGLSRQYLAGKPVFSQTQGQRTAVRDSSRNRPLFRLVCLTLCAVLLNASLNAQDEPPQETVAAEETSPDPQFASTRHNARRPQSDDELRRWLTNMLVYHSYSLQEVQQATGLTPEEITIALERFGIAAGSRSRPAQDEPLVLLPYPGGRHPRIGFLDGAIDPQRETKASVFTPWDASSYVVLDAPEAIWSNLGLTYLAHTHIPTIWDADDIMLPPLEWDREADGSLHCERRLPNGIVFGTRLSPSPEAIRMEMWLTNGTDATLTDLRVQNCVLLKGAAGFTQQSNENKLFWGPFAACRNEQGDRWIITAWFPSDRLWANANCPCLHADPKFPDCPPGETRRLRGWLSFYEGTQIYGELLRIRRTEQGYSRNHEAESPSLIGSIVDAASNQAIPARVHLQDRQGNWHVVQSSAGDAVHYRREPAQFQVSREVHTTLSPAPFWAQLPAGRYTLRVERGKEYLPLVTELTIGEQPLRQTFRLKRWIDMAERGWFSGDTHVHRSLADLPNVMLAEDLNVALPLTYWVTHADTPPTAGDKSQTDFAPTNLINIDSAHVIYPVNTEYEIFTVGEQRHTLGAVFVLNHRAPLPLGAPPVAPIAELARQQGALLDLDKHSWPWSLMLVPVMGVDLFELANNHLWQTEFAFKNWTLDTSATFMDIERDDEGFTEWGWTNYGFQTYYALLNCGFRLRVSGGTASGVHPVQLGFGRVYVHLPDGFNYEDWLAGLNAGRSFVSTGPMLDVRFNGHDAGYQFSVAAGETAKLEITGTAHSKRPLERIELVANGQVVKVIEPENRPTDLGGYECTIREVVEREGSFWLAVRCFEDHPQGRVRFAHTNPVFVDVAGKPVRPRKAEVAYFISRIEEEMARNKGVLDPQSLAEYRQALAQYKALVEIAR